MFYWMWDTTYKKNIFSRIYQQKILANRLAMVGMAGGGWAGGRRPQLG